MQSVRRKRLDLIDTLWNVKAIINEGAFVDNWDLIDTLWNVKQGASYRD